jgi:hypothetical protein
MSYTILNTDGSILTILADNTIDSNSTSLSLIGRNYSGFGQALNNNFIKLLANSANSTPPVSPLVGQIWYDTVGKRLNVFDIDFKAINGAIVAGSQPADLSSGDLWWDSTNNQLNIYNNSTIFTIGPSSGWAPTTINTTVYNANVPPQSLPITLLKNGTDGTLLGYMSSVQSSIGTSNPVSLYLSSLTNTSVKGLTILGDIQYTGKILNNYLSVTIDLGSIATPGSAYYAVPNPLVPTPTFLSTSPGYPLGQNGFISQFLSRIFPINTGSNATITNPGNSSLLEPGVPLNSQVRVMLTCPGYYQIRLFQAGLTAGKTGEWQAPTISDPGVFTFTNIIYQSAAV